MQDKDQKLIWESYTATSKPKFTSKERDRLMGMDKQTPKPVKVSVKKEENDRPSGWENEGYEELDYEKMPFDELKQLSPEEAKAAIGKLNQIDIAIQKSTDRMFNDRETARRNNISGRIKTLQDIITPPPPPETPEEKEARIAKKKSDMESAMQRRRMLQPTKKEFRQNGTFEKIAEQVPGWVKEQSRYQFMGNEQGDGGLPANLQRMIVMDYLEEGELPGMDVINQMIDYLVSRNELSKPQDA